MTVIFSVARTVGNCRDMINSVAVVDHFSHLLDVVVFVFLFWFFKSENKSPLQKSSHADSEFIGSSAKTRGLS